MPLTAEQEKAGMRHLRHWLENEKRVVNYRDLSRAIGCHVDLAKNLLLSFPNSTSDQHRFYKTYLLTGPLLSSSTLAQTQLTAERLKAHEDEKSLAKLSATQRIRVVELDEISDGERNSEDGKEDGDEDPLGVNGDAILGNDRGGEGGISGLGDRRIRLQEEDIVKPEQTPRHGVVMTGEERLEEKKALFEDGKVQIHIYALSPAPIRPIKQSNRQDPAQYLTHIPDLRAHKAYRNPELYGGFHGDLAQTATASSSKPLKDGAMSFGASATKSSVVKKDDKATAPKAAIPKTTGGQATLGKAGTSTASTSTGKKSPSPAPTTAPPAPFKSVSVAKSRTASARAKRQIQSDSEGEDDSPKTDTAEPSEPTKEEMNKALTSSMADQAAMEAMMDMDYDMDDEAEYVDKAKAKTAVKKETEKVTGVRKRRKVQKTRTETNAKGYTVSKNYWTEESCSEGEEDEPSSTHGKSIKRKSTGASGETSPASTTDVEDRKPSTVELAGKGSSTSIGSAASKGKPLPKPAPKPAAGKPKGQSTLAGFFKKK